MKRIVCLILAVALGACGQLGDDRTTGGSGKGEFTADGGPAKLNTEQAVTKTINGMLCYCCDAKQEKAHYWCLDPEDLSKHGDKNADKKVEISFDDFAGQSAETRAVEACQPLPSCAGYMNYINKALGHDKP
ncbi:MAG: hypothetical protein H6707_12535 [Deltaproteobacteria bacterium]|nr:hypothetical protein [Deltaproteobacteria bacterium]